MAKCGIGGVGDGVDLSSVNATGSDVLSGKIIVDKDGNPITGTIPNRGTVNQSLGINGSYTIPEGYHNGNGKVTQSVTTMAGQTVTPKSTQQIISTSGKYLTGNITVSGDANLASVNILRGKSVFGVNGDSNTIRRFTALNVTSSSSSLTLGDGSPWYYYDFNPGFFPSEVCCVSGSIVWRYYSSGTANTNINYQGHPTIGGGYIAPQSPTSWPWSATLVRMPCAQPHEGAWIWCYGY